MFVGLSAIKKYSKITIYRLESPIWDTRYCILSGILSDGIYCVIYFPIQILLVFSPEYHKATYIHLLKYFIPMNISFIRSKVLNTSDRSLLVILCNYNSYYWISANFKSRCFSYSLLISISHRSLYTYSLIFVITPWEK